MHSGDAGLLTRWTRRRFGRDLFALMSGVLLSRRADAAKLDDPPPLYSRAHQFTILDPMAPMPSLQLARLDGHQTVLAHVPDKIMLVNFWASWCPACAVELPQLVALNAAMGDKLTIAAIALDKGGHDVVVPYLRKHGIGGLPIFLDPQGRSVTLMGEPRRAGSFALYGMPTTYVITRGGLIAGYIVGSTDWAGMPARRFLEYYRRR